jgi:hypothetical protein
MDNPVTEGRTTRHIVESNTDTAQPTAATVSTSHFSGTGNPVARLAARQTEMSRTVDHAEGDTDTVKILRAAIDNINWVMDTVNPMTKVCSNILLSLRFAELQLPLSWMPTQH